MNQCNIHPQYLPVPTLGVNPRDFLLNNLTQIDVTHVEEFGKLRLRVAVNTYSGILIAIIQTADATEHMITHCFKCFSYMGIPKEIKMDNGLRYISKYFSNFVSNGILSIKQAFIIILKDKELWLMTLAP